MYVSCCFGENYCANILLLNPKAFQIIFVFSRSFLYLFTNLHPLPLPDHSVSRPLPISHPTPFPHHQLFLRRWNSAISTAPRRIAPSCTTPKSYKIERPIRNHNYLIFFFIHSWLIQNKRSQIKKNKAEISYNNHWHNAKQKKVKRKKGKKRKEKKLNNSIHKAANNQLKVNDVLSKQLYFMSLLSILFPHPLSSSLCSFFFLNSFLLFPFNNYSLQNTYDYESSCHLVA